MTMRQFPLLLKWSTSRQACTTVSSSKYISRRACISEHVYLSMYIWIKMTMHRLTGIWKLYRKNLQKNTQNTWHILVSYRHYESGGRNKNTQQTNSTEFTKSFHWDWVLYLIPWHQFIMKVVYSRQRDIILSVIYKRLNGSRQGVLIRPMLYRSLFTYFRSMARGTKPPL